LFKEWNVIAKLVSVERAYELYKNELNDRVAVTDTVSSE